MNFDPGGQAFTKGLEPASKAIVDLERLDGDVFRSRFIDDREDGHLFGGQVLAQALAAAARTVEGRPCHSAHAYFLRAGRASQPVEFAVERVRDGARFSTRRVVGRQGERDIFDMECSFHGGGWGLEHQVARLPDVPAPECLPDFRSLPMVDGMDGLSGEIAVARRFPHLDLKLIDHERARQPDPEARRRFWVRMADAGLGDDPATHQQYLAYLSDYLLSGAAKLPHPLEYRLPRISATSLDHAIWFHRAHRCDEWALYDCRSSFAADGRGMTEGRLMDREGRLIATVMQEVFFQLRQP